MAQFSGNLDKMRTVLGTPVEYQLPLGDFYLPMNPLIGSHIQLKYAGQIHCVACNRLTKKSFNQGYCFPCFKRLAQCDTCIVRPELCHYAQGTCREPEWGETHCMIPHVVYLANSSGLKVGITRHSQIPTRWMDQGATQAMPLFRVQTRFQSGLVETIFKKYVADKTDWRAMLKGDAEELNLADEAQRLMQLAHEDLKQLADTLPSGSLQAVNEDMLRLSYPVTRYPPKVSSFDFEKTPMVEGVLQGIKGQYLILDTGVINIRKFGGYFIEVNHE